MENVNLLFFNHANEQEETNSIDYSSFMSIVESTLRVSSQSAFVVDFDSHEIIYRTDQLIYLDETISSDVIRACANPYWALVSEETLGELISIRNGFASMYKVLTRYEYSNLICTIDYPINIRNHELYITQKLTPLVMRHDGITKIGLFTINHSTKKNVECLVITPNRRFAYNFSKNEFEELDINVKLTAIEKAILFRIKMGMTSKEIANNLCLSICTVKTHRARIFKKLNVSTISEAITVISNYQLL